MTFEQKIDEKWKLREEKLMTQYRKQMNEYNKIVSAIKEKDEHYD